MVVIAVEPAIVVSLIVLLKNNVAGDLPTQQETGEVPLLSLTTMPATQETPISSVLAPLESEPYAFKGSSSAPLTIIEFSDLQCPW